MNPSSNEAGMQLPPPMPEQAPANLPSESMPQGVEQAMSAVAERAPAAFSQPPAAVPAPPMAMPAPQMMQPQAGAVPSTTPQVAVPLADDGDLIEKEWVHKAKRIVDQTRDDPYKQSEELTVVKADYMKQRYNKTIKLNK